VKTLQTSALAQFRTRNQVFSNWASTTSILHQRKVHIRETKRFSINKGRAWEMNIVFRLKGKRDAESIMK
jgi:hypothetical protein